MPKEVNPEEVKKNKNISCANPSSGAVYGFGFIGALVYFIQQSSGLGEGLFGVVKAIVWPAILVYKFLEFFRM